jgi:drug/metabolite transporter (DMT)-like permease
VSRIGTFTAVLFTALWASAAIATKFGLRSAAPLTLATARFLIAGSILVLYSHLVRRLPWPERTVYRPLFVLGMLNTTIYLGATFVALEYVSPGLFNLFVTTNPLLVALLSRWWLGRSITRGEWGGMVLAGMGLTLASWPSLRHGHASVLGVVLVMGGMTAMALGTVYFSKVQLALPNLTINAWQLVIGGLVLLPFAIAFNGPSPPRWDVTFWAALAWLVLAVSIGAMALWFYLLRADPLHASTWLFLTPVFGYGLQWLLLGTPVTIWDVVGTVLVVTGLAVSGRLSLFIGRSGERGPTVPEPVDRP